MKLARVSFIPFETKGVGVQLKLWDALKTRAIPERSSSRLSSRRNAVSSLFSPLQLPSEEAEL